MSLLAEALVSSLQNYPKTRCYWVAFSGGLDSHVLLHALRMLRGQFTPELRAVHVNHGIYPDADAWSRHCRWICADLDIPLSNLELSLQPQCSQSLEAIARDGRYAALRRLVGAGDILLTAQHCDDQAETVLLQLLRGSGPRGLAGMPALTPFGSGFLARPLLNLRRTQLAEYAREQNLEWIEDTSNQDVRFDRNFLRLRVVPMLEQRWPSLASTLARSARHCAEAQQLVEEIALADRDRVSTADFHILSVTGLRKLSVQRRRAVLRRWIRDNGFRLPDARRIDRISSEVLEARGDKAPQVSWANLDIRRYRDGLYITPRLAPHTATQSLNWAEDSSLILPSGLGRLETRQSSGAGIANRIWMRARISVGFRQGGERCRLPGSACTRKLKKLFQERGVPPWERDRIPLIFVDGCLAMITGLWTCEPFQAQHNESGVEVIWIKPGKGIDPLALYACVFRRR